VKVKLLTNNTSLIYGVGFWLVIALSYLFIFKLPVSRAYVDFGDGNYQYISWRMNSGIQLYTDILSPQPPFHLWLGSLIVKVASFFDCEAYLLFRWTTHLIRVLTSLTLLGIGIRLFGHDLPCSAGSECDPKSGMGIALLASGLFLFLPEGYRWSAGYQSEHLEILFLCLGFLGAISPEKVWRTFGGICAVCAVWTNMSALPFSLLLILMSWLRKPRCNLALLVSSLVALSLAGICFCHAGSAYWENVWDNQVASIPLYPSAWLRSLYEHGTTILTWEGVFILLALMGIYRFSSGNAWDRQDSTQTKGIAPFQLTISLYGIISLGSGIYVIKGGTVDYIYCLAEPMVALFAAYTLVQWFSNLIKPSTAPLQFLTKGVVLIGCLVVLLWQPLRLASGIRAQVMPGIDLPDVSEGRLIEFSEVEVQTLAQVIEELSEPGEMIWAPPYLAALTKHPIAMDLSETYLWWVRWYQSVSEGKPDVGVDQMLKGLTDLIKKQALAFLLINDRTGQWGQLLVPGRELQGIPLAQLDPRLAKLHQALETHYQPVLANPGTDKKLYFQGWNERLELWNPKGGPQFLPPWIREGFAQ
jgi:hypothetical protein